MDQQPGHTPVPGTKPEKPGAGPISSIPVVEVISVVIAATELHLGMDYYNFRVWRGGRNPPAGEPPGGVLGAATPSEGSVGYP